MGEAVKCAFPKVSLEESLLLHGKTQMHGMISIELLANKTAEDNPLRIITELSVHYKIDDSDFVHRKVFPFPSPYMTAKDVLDALNFKEFDRYLLTVGGYDVDMDERMIEIDTSSSCPLVIKHYVFFLQHENNKPKRKFCNPLEFVMNFIGEHCFAYHNGKRIDRHRQMKDLGEISREKPLVSKSSEVKVFVDGEEKKEIEIDDDDDIESVKEKLGKKGLLSNPTNENGYEVSNLDDFILETTKDNRSLYFKSFGETKPKYSHHSILVSKAAKSQSCMEHIDKYSKEFELNTHWLSMDIYDQFCSVPEEDDRKFSERFTNMMKGFSYRQDPKVLSDEEYVYSAMFFRALDRFLFPEDDTGCILHQPSLTTKDRPDGYIATLKSDLPSLPILTSDFKKQNEDFKVAKRESIGYFQSIMTSCGKYFPVLVMPCTRQALSLYLCWPIDSFNHATIKICETQDEEEFAHFFCALKFAVRYLATKESFVGTTFTVEPKKGLKLKQTLVANRDVYELDGYVYKLFNTKMRPWAVPNADIIRSALGDDYLPGIEEVELTKGCKYLKYKYIDDDKKNLTFKDFEPIMDTLDKLHKCGYVHSDVRLQNMLFPSDRHKKAKLIDFDLTAAPGVKYPMGYNQFEERHDDAKANEKRQFIHDRYSLCYIIKREVVELTTEERSKCYSWLNTKITFKPVP